METCTAAAASRTVDGEVVSSAETAENTKEKRAVAAVTIGDQVKHPYVLIIITRKIAVLLVPFLSNETIYVFVELTQAILKIT